MVINNILKAYEVEDYETQLIQDGFHETWAVHSEPKKILRIYKKSHRSLPEIENELSYLDYLAKYHVAIAPPIKNLKGELFSHFDNDISVLFPFACGKIERDPNNEQSYMAGVEMAKLHIYSAQFQPKQKLKTYDFNELLYHPLEQLNHHFEEKNETLEYILQQGFQTANIMKDLDSSFFEMGIIHNDLHLENCFFNHNSSFTMFDFDFFGIGYYIYDISIFIWSLFKDSALHKARPEAAKHFVKGYLSQRHIRPEELRHVLHFIITTEIWRLNIICMNPRNDRDFNPQMRLQDAARRIKECKDEEHSIFNFVE